jgi:hypothetical protein
MGLFFKDLPRAIGCEARVGPSDWNEVENAERHIGSALFRLIGKDETQCAPAEATVYRSGDRKLLEENCGGRSAAKAPGKRM